MSFIHRDTLLHVDNVVLVWLVVLVIFRQFKRGAKRTHVISNSAMCFPVHTHRYHAVVTDTVDQEITKSDEVRLIQTLCSRLLSAFGTISRPVLNASHSIRVQFGLSLYQIIGINDKSQLLTAKMWKDIVSISGGS